jgi:hypothetical protein
MCRSPLLPLLARELGATAPMVGFVVAASTITGAFLKRLHGVFGTIYDVGDAGDRSFGGTAGAAMGYSPTFQLIATLAGVTAMALLCSRGRNHTRRSRATTLR